VRERGEKKKNRKESDGNMKRILIIGGGYSGIAAAKALLKKTKNKGGYEILLAEKNRYHTLMTQLHEVAGRRIHPQDVQVRYDKIFRGKNSHRLEILQQDIVEIDFAEKRVTSRENISYQYDYLVLATGSRPAFFQVENAAKNAFPLWSHKEAVIIAEKVADCFYLADKEPRGERRNDLLTFSVAGGGFTGVEMAGELSVYCKKMCKGYGIEADEVKINILEGAGTILGNLDRKSAKRAEKYLKQLGVQVRNGAVIRKVEEDKIHLQDGEVLPGTLIWSAGVKGNPTPGDGEAYWNKRERVEVNKYLQSRLHENVFCVGDNLSLEIQGKQMPQIVEHARQSGMCAGENVLALDQGKALKEYAPKFHGSMVSVGPVRAVASLGKIRLSSIFATALKHLVNLHYHWDIGGIPLAFRYLDAQFIRRFFPFLFSQKTGPLDKQPTQFYDVQE
jgi:NADH dehydrogenase